MNPCPNCGAITEESDNYCGQCRFELVTDKISAPLTNQEINVEDVRNNLALVYFKMGKLKQALEIFEKNLELNPKDLNAVHMIDLIKQELKKQ